MGNMEREQQKCARSWRNSESRDSGWSSKGDYQRQPGADRYSVRQRQARLGGYEMVQDLIIAAVNQALEESGGEGGGRSSEHYEKHAASCLGDLGNLFG